MKNTIILIIVVFSILSTSWAQISEEVLNKKLLKIAKNSNLPGFGLAIVKYDSILFSNGYGLANLAQKKPYSIKTIQPIGSISKTFIAFALMKAIDIGGLDLENNINDLLPFKIINPNFPNDSIKIKHLVSHTSGLLDTEVGYSKAYNLGKRPNESLDNFLKNYYKPDGKYYTSANFANAPAGMMYNYSNIASALAAYIIELKSGLSFDFFIKKHLFEPLEMTESHWFYDELLASKYATLYELNKQNDPILKTFINKDKSFKDYVCATYPDGSLRTSINDITLFLKEMIKGYNGKSNLLSEKSYKTLFAKQFSESNMPTNMNPKEPNKAIFWSYNRKGNILHTGSDFGISTFLRFDPSTNIGVVLFINTQLDGENNKKTLASFQKVVDEIEKYIVSLNR
jgi:CubicO group peptidase (beta-lactamase class C family)